MPPKRDHAAEQQAQAAKQQKFADEIKSLQERLKAYDDQLTADPQMNRGTVNTVLRQLGKMETKFETIFENLVELIPSERLRRPVYDKMFNDVESRYRERQAELADEFSSADFASSTVHQRNPNATLLENDDNLGAVGLSLPKIPELKLPNFDGSRKEWISYKKFIQDVFMGRANLPDICKYQYLKASCISGKAKDIVLAVRDSNFETAWTNLCTYYDNDTLLKYLLLDDLYNVTTPKENDVKSLEDFINTVESNVSYFESIGTDTKQWELLLGYHILKRLDRSTQIEFEKIRSPDAIITVEIILKFLRQRISVLTVTTAMNKPSVKAGASSTDDKKKPLPNRQKSLQATAKPFRRCSFCEQSHSVWNCPTLKDLSVPDIKAKAKELNLCFNCFKPNHRIDSCSSQNGCSKCGSRKHHTMIHPKHFNQNNTDKPQTERSTAERPYTEQSKSTQSSSSHEKVATSIGTSVGNVVLVTAVIWIESSNGTYLPCRAFLDSGSTCNFITTKLAQRLKLPLSRTMVTIEGVNCQDSCNKQKTTATIKSRFNDYSETVDFLVSKKIMNDIPMYPVNTFELNLPPQCELADPLFHQPAAVDLLLGAEVFYAILKTDKIKLNNGLWLYDSEFGHLIAGRTESVSDPKQISCVAISDLHDQMKKFWEIESCASSEVGFSIEEKAAENHYQANVQRLPDGKYQVALPFNNKVNNIGESSLQTRSIFISTERRLNRNKDKKKHYDEFMNEMLELKHMEVAEDLTDPQYFMTHHMIERPTSTTTKYRVVFNASKKTSSGVSLNDVLMTGPTIQADVFTHLLRWREFPIAITADITKMYRQIWIRPEDRKFQRIWWRPTPTSKVIPYQGTTVMYGTGSAPFAAIRTLKQLAFDEIDRYPDVTDLLLNNFYVDDFVKSFKDVTEATKSKDRLSQLLNTGGFELRKWASNTPELADKYTENESLTSILGLQWNKETDHIILDFLYLKTHSKITKSTVLSEIAQFFDPLGLATPIILRAKCFMQRLWEEINLSWDDELNSNLADEWINFRNELITIPPVLVSRPLIINPNSSFKLHGFADASDIGYGACIYIISSTTSLLVCAKSRVAPLKRLTTPRLELVAALLLAKLMRKVINSLSTKPEETHLWSDSEITLYRIKSAASKYNQFVSTRVADIQDCTSPTDWKFVPTDLNPADVASRGVSPIDLVNNNLWWHGPEFILKPQIHWPDQSKFTKFTNSDETELKKQQTIVILTVKNNILSDDFAKCFSTWLRIKYAVVKLIKWMLNSMKNKKYHLKSTANVQELQEAETRLVIMTQKDYFGAEIRDLIKNKSVNKSSPLIKLNPFIDESGIIRVGGRLSNSSLQFDEQHQVVLPKCTLSRLILEHVHIQNLHCGPQMLVNSSRRNYWIIGARSMARSIVHKCMSCFRNKPVLLKQIMGSLPSRRVTPARAFLNVGIDFAGPFYIRPIPRTKTLWKTYVAVFTCFVTRAVHLEVIPDLSSTTFINGLRRFVAARGYPNYVCTDNATNFIGARRILQELYHLFTEKENLDSIKKFFTDNNIEWQTIPARSPHIGGVWESMVKNLKYHLNRATKDKVYTPDDFQTLIKQIEGILNSRPLQPLSNEADDFQCLTPGHFLICAPLNSIPEPDWSNTPIRRLEQWQQLQVQLTDIWRRFQHDYLHQLQQRTKWNTSEPDVKPDTLVLIHEENLPPTQWRMGRVVKVYPGSDNKVRVVELKTADGTLRRAANKIAPLPIYDLND